MRDITKYSVALASLALGIIGAGLVSVVFFVRNKLAA